MLGSNRFVLAFVALLFAAGGHAADKTVDFVTDSEKKGGFLVEVTRAAFERVGYHISVEYLPWARALNNVLTGHAEAILGIYHSEERAGKLQYTHSIGASELLFFKLATTPIQYRKLQDLQPYRIGTINGAAYPAEFEAAQYLKKEPEKSYQTNLKKLQAGRIDLMLEKRRVVEQALTEYPDMQRKVVALQPPLATRQFFNAFSREMPNYHQKVEDFNRGLALISKDGTLRKIMARHLHE